jgi:hypothetical protein
MVHGPRPIGHGPGPAPGVRNPPHQVPRTRGQLPGSMATSCRPPGRDYRPELQAKLRGQGPGLARPRPPKLHQLRELRPPAARPPGRASRHQAPGGIGRDNGREGHDPWTTGRVYTFKTIGSAAGSGHDKGPAAARVSRLRYVNNATRQRQAIKNPATWAGF